MKKNKGFTLIEIISVVVVLAIIALLVTPIVSKILDNNRDRLYNNQIDGIIKSAKVWGAEHVGRLPGDGEKDVVITLGELQTGGYADKTVKNTKTNENFDPDKTKIIISNKGGIISYKVEIEE